jgi:hypothetical protein
MNRIAQELRRDDLTYDLVSVITLKRLVISHLRSGRMSGVQAWKKPKPVLPTTAEV